MYTVTKTYGHDLGLSAAFRQWRATSHCNQIHGYALAFRLEFEAATLDERNWVIDFGGLKPVREWLVAMFDHKLLVAEDDPQLETIRALAAAGVANVAVLATGTGCEAFAAITFAYIEIFLIKKGYAPRVRIKSVTVSEHGANSATYTGEDSAQKKSVPGRPDL
jgi:6-pyruvoyltetrahydropterin/6-carboxytetrahydropterin synthase